jgi:hypothetical protein
MQGKAWAGIEHMALSCGWGVLCRRTDPGTLRVREKTRPAFWTGHTGRIALNREHTMNNLGLLPMLLIIWGVVMVSFLALLAYRGQITRYEEDQLFLNGNNGHEEQEQHEILRKVSRLQPFVRAVGGAASLITFSIIGLWFYNVWQRFQ